MLIVWKHLTFDILWGQLSYLELPFHPKLSHGTYTITVLKRQNWSESETHFTIQSSTSFYPTCNEEEFQRFYVLLETVFHHLQNSVFELNTEWKRDCSCMVCVIFTSVTSLSATEYYTVISISQSHSFLFSPFYSTFFFFFFLFLNCNSVIRTENCRVQENIMLLTCILKFKGVLLLPIKVCCSLQGF